MAVTQNTYTGDGTTVLFSFTFPYLETTDIKVSLNGTITTAYTLANATTIQFNTAPANGVAIRIYRSTDDSSLAATFYPGSAIRANDLNDNFTQTLYVTQEAVNSIEGAFTNVTVAEAAAASAAASAATAVSTSITASADASTAIATANSALSVANSTTTIANNAVTTANGAETLADNAVAIANTASATATAASDAVANALQYTRVANVAAIPSSPTDSQAVEVTDSTGIQSFTPLSGKPVGFVGDSGLYVRLVYTTTGSTWNWIQYGANDAETRYLKQATAANTYAPLASPALTGTPTASTASVDTNTTQLATTAYVVGQGYLKSATASSTYAPLASPTFTGSVTFPSGQRYPQIPQNSQTSGYTLVASDAGKHVSITTGGVTVPSSVFAVGDAVSIYNNSSSSQTIIASGVTLRQAGTVNTGNRTLAQYGVATILCVATDTFVITGAGLS